MSNTIEVFSTKQVNFDYLLSVASRFGIKFTQSFVQVDVPFKITSSRIKLLNYIIFKIVSYSSARPTYAYMAKECGLSRKAVYNAIQDFKAYGLINVIDRHLDHKANIYSLGPVFMNATVCLLLGSIFPRLNLARIRTMQRNSHPDYTPLSTNVDVLRSNTSSTLLDNNKKKIIQEKRHWLTTIIGKAWKNMVTWIENDSSVSRSDFNKRTFEYKLTEQNKKNLKVVNTSPKIAPPVVVKYSHKDHEHSAKHNQLANMFAQFIPRDLQ